MARQPAGREPAQPRVYRFARGGERHSGVDAGEQDSDADSMRRSGGSPEKTGKAPAFRGPEVRPQDLAELQSAALVLAHVAHFASDPEEAVLQALEVDLDAWERIRDSALDKLSDDVDAGLAFSRVFSRTKAELATRSPSLADLLAAHRPTEAPALPPVASPEPRPEPAQAPLEAPPLAPEPPRQPSPAPQLPSFARAAAALAPAPVFVEPTLEVAVPPAPAPAAYPAAPPALVRPALPNALTGKETGALDPEMIRRAALPFAGKGSPPPHAAHVARVAGTGGQRPREDSLPASDGDTLPAGAGATPGAGPPTALTLRQYAELHAALSRGEGTRAALLLRAGLDEASFTREDALQRQRLAGDAIAMAQFKAMFAARGGRA